MGSTETDKTLGSWPLSFLHYSPSLGRLAGQVGADGLAVVERATCPAPPRKVSWVQASEPDSILSVCPYVRVGGRRGWGWRLSAQERFALLFLGRITWRLLSSTGPKPEPKALVLGGTGWGRLVIALEGQD